MHACMDLRTLVIHRLIINPHRNAVHTQGDGQGAALLQRVDGLQMRWSAATSTVLRW